MRKHVPPNVGDRALRKLRSRRSAAKHLDQVARDRAWKPCTVRYEAVNAMLLNEFLKEHRMVEEQEGRRQKSEATMADQQHEVAALGAAGLNGQVAPIQTGSARVGAVEPPRLK
jgi:hypothetical protein